MQMTAQHQHHHYRTPTNMSGTAMKLVSISTLRPAQVSVGMASVGFKVDKMMSKAIKYSNGKSSKAQSVNSSNVIPYIVISSLAHTLTHAY
jgi:hypothetical protein